jgi:hypothetical protein
MQEENKFDSEFENDVVEMDASRVCDAIAKIGYSPASALMDIIDNSVTAEATEIIVEIETDTDKTFAAKNNVITYRIIDNGKGMNQEEIKNSLKLGSESKYQSNSLSKYGMGLKSAGFSVGTRIQIISKKEGVFSPVSFVDKDEIRSAGKYVVSRLKVDADALQEYGKKISDYSSGTIIEITRCQNIKQDSAQKTLKKLEEQLGVVYYTFLTQKDNPLSITLRCTGKPDVKIVPHDILFTERAKTGFDEDTYDMKSTYIVFSEDVSLQDYGVEEPMKLEAVIFPQDQMKTIAHFTEEERKKIGSYKVSRNNSGFFIYRNNRLIRWGDDLGIVGRDNQNFRARIVLNTAHDDAFHVDVSKQRMDVPEDVEAKISHLMRLPLRYSELAMKICSDFKKNPEKKEGSGFNYNNQDLAEDETEELTGEDKIKTVRERKKELIEQTEENENSEPKDEPQESDEVVESIPLFERVRYSDKVQGFTVWEAGFDSSDGSYVRINRNHSYYGTVLSRLEEDKESRQAIEAIFWASAVAYNNTFSKMTDIDSSTISKILERFKKEFAMNLDNWCNHNQNLYDRD